MKSAFFVFAYFSVHQFRSTRIMHFEDSRHFRESLNIVLNGPPGFECVGAYGDAKDLLVRINRNVPDIVLMDIEMP